LHPGGQPVHARWSLAVAACGGVRSGLSTPSPDTREPGGS
jgi:hypothetical protein